MWKMSAILLHELDNGMEQSRQNNVICHKIPDEEKNMFRKSLFLIIIVALGFLAAGCGPRQTKLTAADNGGQVEVKVGERIVVELEGNPSTGYTWEAKDLDASMFQQVGEVEFRSGNPGLLGAGGTLTLTFETLKPGTATLTLVYHRPWETDVEPVDTFTVAVTAK
jgi:predicted secreted protein